MRNLSFLVLIIPFVFISTISLQAQCLGWKKNHQYWQVRTGIGILPTFFKDQATTIHPPLSIELNYRPTPRFSLGLLAGSSLSSVNLEHHSGSSLKLRNKFQMIALRGAVHSQRWEHWKPYGGISLAYQHNKVEKMEAEKGTTNPIHYTPRKSGFFYSAFVGTCYQPTTHLEIFGELGYGLSLLTLGVGFSW
jgi:hypothetical protein